MIKCDGQQVRYVQFVNGRSEVSDSSDPTTDSFLLRMVSAITLTAVAHTIVRMSLPIFFVLPIIPVPATNHQKNVFLMKHEPSSQESVSSNSPNLPNWLPVNDTSLNRHLKSCKEVNNPSLAKPNIILGNEAADLDSIACTVVLSFISHQPTVPVINIKRSELHLRRDAVNALRAAGVDLSNLNFIDDSQIVLENANSITLVDHNALAPHQAQFAPLVTALIDHHVDENSFPNARPRTINKVGSCATLLAEHALHRKPSDMSLLQPSVVLLLISAILLDCHNMSPEIGKATSRDKAAIKSLVEIAQISESQTDTLFTLLYAARTNVTGFTAIDLMRKDAKIVHAKGHRVGICSIGISFTDLLSRSKTSVQNAVEEIATDWAVDCIILMLGYSSNDTYTRKLLISRSVIGDFIANALKGPEADTLQLDCTEHLPGFHAFHQHNVKASRKVVLPICKAILLRLDS